mgnify:CR=1 FL=1
MADDAVASWLEENGHSGSFFFFKQKTAYEIIAGDWSSDVCSSDLLFLVQFTVEKHITIHFILKCDWGAGHPAMFNPSPDRKSVV